MKIAVLSCDKNEETFAPFHHCMEKYWPGHPEVIYHTNGIINPYYKTIMVPEDLSHWTKGVREFLNQIDDEIILISLKACILSSDFMDNLIIIENGGRFCNLLLLISIL